MFELTTTPQQFQEVPFLGKTIDCLLIESVPYVIVNSVIEAIGLAEHAAKRCIKNDEILAQGVLIWAPPIQKYQGQSVLCLQLKLLPGWLFSVEINRTKPEVRANLLAFRKDAYDVLFNHYFGKATEVSTGLKRKFEIDAKIKSNKDKIKRLMYLNDEIKTLRQENAELLREKNSISKQFSAQLGLFDFKEKEVTNV